MIANDNERTCANCLFGILAPDRYAAKRKPGKGEKPGAEQPPPVWHCSINPPTYPSGAPVTSADARCAFYTERDGEHAQPFRRLGQTAATNATAGGMIK